MEETVEQDDTSFDGDDSGNKRHREENFPGEEWLIIEEGEDGKNVASSQSVERDNGSSCSEISYSDVDYSSDAEEAREMPLPQLSEEAAQIGEAEERGQDRKDDSDGASAPMESTGHEDKSDPIVSSENVVLQIVPKRNRGDRFKEVATCVNLLIACSMVIAIGIGLGLKWHGAQRMSQHLDYATIKMENDRLIEQIKQLTSAKEILDEIKPGITRPTIIETNEYQRPMKDPAEESVYPKKEPEARYRSPHRPSELTPFERLQDSLSTICSILGDVQQSETATYARPSPTCDTRSTFSDLFDLRVLLYKVIKEMDDSTKSTNHKFLTNIQSQIDSASESFVFELARSLDKANAKNQKKVGKMVEKVNARLCMLRNTMSSDNKLKLFLDANGTFLENCDNIVWRKMNGGIKERWKKENSTDSSARREGGDNFKPARPNNPQGSVPYEISDSDASKLRNVTKVTQAKAACRQSAWQTRKCCNNDLNDGISRGSEETEETEETCSALLAPPRSTWKKTKRSTSREFSASRTTNGSKNDKAVHRKESTTKGPIRRGRSKGDGAPSKRVKIKNTQISMGDQKDDELKKRKASPSMNGRNELRMKNNIPAKQPSSHRSNIQYEGLYPAEPTSRRSKKRLGRANSEEERREREKLPNGDWQFARSRFRDQLRKDKFTENWYFDRAGNRKFSRSNRNGESKEEQPR